MDIESKRVYTSINEAMGKVHEMASSRGAGIVSANNFGSNGAFFSVTLDNKELFFSYATLVAVNAPGHGQFKTNERFSSTTSRHMTRMGVGGYTEIDQEELEQLAVSV